MLNNFSDLDFNAAFFAGFYNPSQVSIHTFFINKNFGHTSDVSFKYTFLLKLPLMHPVSSWR
jgi:hypothetical protein